jgi:NAD+ kinase
MALKIKTIGMVSKRGKSQVRTIARDLVKWISRRKIKVLVESELAEEIDYQNSCPKEDLAKYCDLILTLGGDGTLLSVVKSFEEKVVPILGINLGGLGFLTEVSPDEAKNVLENILKGELVPQKRMMLKAEMKRQDRVRSRWLVLNDVVINKGALARMVDLKTFVDDKYVTTYKCDGIIVATPTGSTAYSLAAGGPLITHDLSSMLITPICPHMLTNRSIVISGGSIVKIVLEVANGKVFLTLDGQRGVALEEGDVIEVSRSEKEMLMFGSKDKDYYTILRTKLKWGER